MKRMLGLVISLALATVPRPVSACAVVGRGSTPARLSGESTLMAWDEVAHVEHFVRAVRFAAGTARFGFIVPVPNKPTVGEAQEALFEKLEELATPPPDPFSKGVPATASALASADTVTVVERAKIKGLDYVVLQAKGGKELTAWLDENRFASYPELAPWADVYAKEDAFFVAFKYELPEGKPAEALPGAVRISFATQRPFYPYREPRPQGAGARMLRLFVLADGPASASVAGGKWASAPTFSGSVPDDQETLVETFVPGMRLPKSRWLTAYTDTEAERPAADLFFSFGWRYQKHAPSMAIALLGGGIAFGGIALLLRRRRRRILGIT